MNIFMLPPLQAGYDFQAGNNLREQQAEGGMPRKIIKYVGAVHTVTASVYLKDPSAQQYFWAFWRQNKMKNFHWVIVTDAGELELSECSFSANDVPKEQDRGGGKIIINFTVNVIPKLRDPDFDLEIIRLWENGLIKVFDDIQKIPNVWLPAALGV